MRIPVVITVLLLAAAAVIGWQDHRRLDRLRAAHAELLTRAAAQGVSIDPGDPTASPRLSKRLRVNRAAEARQVASSFMAYGRDMEAYQKQRRAEGGSLNDPDEATRHRMKDELDQVMALDGDQLKILIEEIRVSGDVDDDAKQRLLRFALDRLTKDYPREALAILTDTPGMLEQLRRTNGVAEGVVFSAVRGWTKLDPDAASKWVRERAGTLPSELADKASDGLIFGVADRDVRLTLRLVNEYGKDPSSYLKSILLRDGQTPQQRNESLAAYREWKSTPNASRMSEQVSEEILPDLAFGPLPYRNAFGDVAGWVDESNFTPEELALLCKGLAGRVKPAETGEWLAWLDTKLPPAAARSNAWHLFNSWLDHDFEAARQWATDAPDTPAKHTATRAYAEKLFPDQPEEAIRLALCVPPGLYRQITLERLYDRWPKDDEASRQAAEAFAKENGLLK